MRSAHSRAGSAAAASRPIAAHARIEGDRLVLEGLVAEPDGSRMLRDSSSGSASEARELGRSWRSACSRRAPDPLLERLRSA